MNLKTRENHSKMDDLKTTHSTFMTYLNLKTNYTCWATYKFSRAHYKIYIKPVLETLDESELGVWIGPVNVSRNGVAYDLYLNSDPPSKLQDQLDIAANNGQLYKNQVWCLKNQNNGHWVADRHEVLH
jgi:hypothetical protein